MVHHHQLFCLSPPAFFCLGTLRLEKNSKIIKANHHPKTTMRAKPCPELPHLHGFWTPPGMGTPPLPWAAWSDAWSLFSVQTFFPISNLNLPWRNLRSLPLALSLVTCEKAAASTARWFLINLHQAQSQRFYCRYLHTDAVRVLQANLQLPPKPSVPPQAAVRHRLLKERSVLVALVDPQLSDAHGCWRRGRKPVPAAQAPETGIPAGPGAAARSWVFLCSAWCRSVPRQTMSPPRCWRVLSHRLLRSAEPSPTPC